ncbi:LysR family transcriptional regulator [Novosphingobium umbonatum]|uniref:LysR family transcriptional regulator n=1 Tax=Novosphingobium umbonatum TaxID=1908524 RepID=A0A3S2X4Q1_9SPHN|nr:LysR family transcriptional regulator [Novosphingobium umbonatum]RVU05708.1 LysR family transcriptional regulator [Novosphingobium umbonatum]
MRWQLDDLSYYCAIVETGGVTAAARRLDCPKSTVSKALTRLEHDLGMRLVERSSRALRITQEGEAFHARASSILELATETDAFMQGLRAAPSGKVRLAAPPAFCREILSPRLVDFVARYPAIELDIITNLSQPDVTGGACDLAVVAGMQPDSGLSQRHLLGGRLIWITSPAYAQAHDIRPDSTPDFGHIKLVESRYNSQALSLRVHGETQKLALGRKVMQITDPLAVRAAVEAGLGVSFLPDRYCHAGLSNGSLTQVWTTASFDQEAARMTIIYPGQRLLSPRYRAVIDFLEAICKA